MPTTIARGGGACPVPMPDLTGIEPWRGDKTAYWWQTVTERPTDQVRTDALAKQQNLVVRMSGGNKPVDGTSYGAPFQIIDETLPRTKVWDLNKPLGGTFFRPTYPIVDVPFPEPLVRREGDPGEAFDQHWRGYDPTHEALWELILVQFRWANRLKTRNTTEWTINYNGAGTVCRWDTLKPWNATGQPRGVVAIGVPFLPHLVRYEELAAGRIGHCMALVVPNYSPERTGPARGSDGDLGAYPLRAGERLRLKQVILDATTNPQQRVFAQAARDFGVILIDRNHGDHASITMSQDVRWQSINRPTWALSDFEVIEQ